MIKVDEILVKKRVEHIASLIASGKRNIIIAGEVGVGKTYTAKLLDHEFFIDDVTFKTHLASNNLRLRGPEDWGASIDKYPLEALSKKKIVVYDDFGSSEMTEAYITKTLYRLNERKNRDLITIFTTNLGQEKRAEIEPKISSRVLENSATVIIQGPDLRKTGNLVIKIK